MWLLELISHISEVNAVSDGLMTTVLGGHNTESPLEKDSKGEALKENLAVKLTLTCFISAFCHVNFNSPTLKERGSSFQADLEWTSLSTQKKKGCKEVSTLRSAPVTDSMPFHMPIPGPIPSA